MDVETETSRDWLKDVDTETPSRLLLISDVTQRVLRTHHSLVVFTPSLCLNQKNFRLICILKIIFSFNIDKTVQEVKT